ncbi:MAG TPA: two-component regulator propeller domain-containing protein [Pyrinomonadaceae bacterium]|nr:two-component regulator propeller domain-containing protein [Pyrinomonadaceae bacterium]
MLAILTLILCVAGFQIYRIYQDAESKLAKERSRLKEQNIVTFEKVRLTPHSQNFVQIIQNTSDTRDLIRFQDSYFAATDGGLLQLSPEGKLIKHWTVLDGLPESDLTSLTVFDTKLFIGTRTKGIVTFDGENFVQFRFTECETQAITNFLNDNGRLLIGTFNGGLLEFDGKVFREIKAENQTLKTITFLEKINAILFVGTFNNGLWIYENDIWKHLTTTEGLPSNRVIGVVKNGENLLVATDFGLSVLENDKFRTIKILPMISSLEKYEDQIYVSTENGEFFIFDKQLKEVKETVNSEKSRLIGMDNQLFLLTDHGIFRDFKSFPQTDNNELANNFATSIAFDKNGNLWAGTFRHGIDVFTAEGKKIKHIEDNNIREINYLQLQNDEILAATSKGLWKAKSDFSVENIEQGSITHFSADAVATNKGLKIGEKLFTNVNGLPSNSTYTTLQVGKKLYVGTLGGLAEIQQNKVVKTFTDANSKLTNNWITSLCLANERLFIGTYGGGVLELMPSGELHDFSNEIDKFVVNPNAIFSDNERLYVGTLNGAKVLNFQTNKWLTIKDILPSESVFSINENAGNIYFATTNGIAKVDKSYFDEVEKR